MDLGCGEGKVAQVLFNGEKVDVGLDKWPEMAVAAKHSGIYNMVVLGDACRLPFSDESFATIFSNSVIEHIPGIQSVLRETARVLKPKGVFIATVPSEKFGGFLFFYRLFNALGLSMLARWYKRVRNQKLSHYNCFTPDEWKVTLSKEGLEVVEMRYYLSETTISVWDFIAALGFCWRTIAVWNRFAVGRQMSHSLAIVTRRLRVRFLSHVLKKYYLEHECTIGGGLSIIAVRAPISTERTDLEALGEF
jgi:SAM-dependent methyltransferase